MVKRLLACLALTLPFAPRAAAEVLTEPARFERGRAYPIDPVGLEMFNQATIKPQEMPITYPTGVVSRRGVEPALSRDEAETQLPNPVPASPESVRAGRVAWTANCAACHGLNAKGETPVAEKLMTGGSPLWDITLTNPGRADGYIYGTIRNGGVNMPAYGAQTTPDERWHIVNFLRSLTQQ